MYNKAITALITNAIILAGVLGLDIEVTPETIASISLVLSTALVWLVPNKA